MPTRRLIVAVLAFLTVAGPARAATPTILVKFKQPSAAANRIEALGDDAVGQTANRVSIVRLRAGESAAARIAAYSERFTPRTFRRATLSAALTTKEAVKKVLHGIVAFAVIATIWRTAFARRLDGGFGIDVHNRRLNALRHLGESRRHLLRRRTLKWKLVISCSPITQVSKRFKNFKSPNSGLRLKSGPSQRVTQRPPLQSRHGIDSGL